MPFPTPREAFSAAIERREGLWQASPNDPGNYAPGPDGSSVLVGTMRGVTPTVFAAYRGLAPGAVTAAMMRAEVTLALAAEIAEKSYYEAAGFARLEWSPLVAIAVDIGWGSGPLTAIKMLQRLVGAEADGVIGPFTAALVERHLATTPIMAACDALTAARKAFYLSISEPGSRLAAFRRGWLDRADWFMSTAPWFEAWRGWAPAASNGGTA